MLSLRIWDGAGEGVGPAKSFVYLNGLESHSLWASSLAECLAGRGHRFVGLDRRGSGINRHISGTAREWLSDVAEVCKLERGRGGAGGVWLIGQCFGARLALAAALKHPRLADGLILLSPGLRMMVDLTPPEKVLVAVGKVLRLPIRIQSPIRDDRFFTTDPEWLRYMAEDPLRLSRVAAGDYYSAHILLRTILRAERPLSVKCLALFASGDRVVDVGATIAVLERLFPGNLTVRKISGADHFLLFGRAGAHVRDALLEAVG